MRAMETVVRGLDGSLDHVTLRQRASAALGDRVPADLAVWAVLDPATLMWSHCVLDGAARDVDLENAVFDNEYRVDDVLKVADVAAGGHAVTLHSATSGDPASSARYRDVFTPRGITDELRLPLHDGRTTWGLVVLLRSGGTFSPDEVGATSELARPLGTALRDSLVRTGRDLVGGNPSGTILTARDGRVLDLSDDARALLGSDGPDAVPAVVQAIAARRAAGGPASATTPTRDGRWLALHASALGKQLAVVVEEVRPHQVADLVVRGRGLTPREREVLAAVARGLSNRQVARELAMSEFTVLDHVKKLFAKFGVASRGELTASLFFDHYALQHTT
ncbi:LuxR C-terminal-related transcriptional regulator [Pseudonocardia endophytica]|uniref:GAF domain-containing protein n=1 Tax=Pseudonocardia endophytica TaxID=401976 RepID=A0A4R1HJV9_PSEEN|nr:LuxR C-terminal-related transcriptional regulator [Pseudonocardia endophytica]TCK22627.1 GAF domain-containing protein [Pseudonocardia endophytica]